MNAEEAWQFLNHNNRGNSTGFLDGLISCECGRPMFWWFESLRYECITTWIYYDANDPQICSANDCDPSELENLDKRYNL